MGYGTSHLHLPRGQGDLVNQYMGYVSTDRGYSGRLVPSYNCTPETLYTESSHDFFSFCLSFDNCGELKIPPRGYVCCLSTKKTKTRKKTWHTCGTS